MCLANFSLNLNLCEFGSLLQFILFHIDKHVLVNYFVICLIENLNLRILILKKLGGGMPFTKGQN